MDHEDIANLNDIVEYVVGDSIYEEAAFSWWVPYTLKKRDHIIAKVKACFPKNSHKLGVEVPTLVKEAYRLHQKNNNTLLCDAIK